ncbi:MAG: hypothetical protein IJD58_12900 [Lachnospiraceae bacterium]|nr:hypothetical protein [Lachnospiraceae bacterium]
MRIKRINQDDIKVSNKAKVKVKTAGNTQVVQFTAGNNKTCSVVNLSKDTYLDKKTGEVKHKKKSESRYQSPKSVRKSINRLMDLIRCNATEPAKCKWLSVTYAETMTDGKRAFLDAKLFLRKLKRYLAKQIELTIGQKTFKYITVAEPQGESHGNSWHLHILLIFDDTAPFIENDTIAELWGYGITSTNKVFDGDGLALYFKVHLSDVEYEDNSDETDNKDIEDIKSNPAIVEKTVDGVTKMFIKGERLKYYPSGMNLYSSSRGMKKPDIQEMTNAEAMEVVANSKLVYRETYVIGDKGNGNLVDKRYYQKSKKTT